MRPDELEAGGDVAAVAASGVVRHVQEWHRGISGRVFSLIGAPAAPVRVIHDGIADAVYGTVATTLKAAITVGAGVASTLAPRDADSVLSSTRGRLVVGALNGVYGDMLERDGNALASAMSIVVAGQRVDPGRATLTRAFPDATGRVAVFLHGLCETEDAWQLRRERSVPYGERLAEATGYTPVYVRYNTGRHISANGQDLAALLSDLVAGWPTEVEEIALIGHSMGGLVARSACHYGAGTEGVTRVRHVFALGAPHHGAQLERLAHAAGAALHRIPETRAISTALGLRSVGIRDLYHGYLVEEDWESFDPNAFLVAEAREIPFLETANHYFVAATLSRDPDAPASRAFGDLLVSRPSAWAQRPHERVRFALDNYRSVGGATHFDLLNHPAIGEQLVHWLGAERPAVQLTLER